jgi:hypothetical protein
MDVNNKEKIGCAVVGRLIYGWFKCFVFIPFLKRKMLTTAQLINNNPDIQKEHQPTPFKEPWMARCALPGR